MTYRMSTDIRFSLTYHWLIECRKSQINWLIDLSRFNKIIRFLRNFNNLPSYFLLNLFNVFQISRILWVDWFVRVFDNLSRKKTDQIKKQFPILTFYYFWVVSIQKFFWFLVNSFGLKITSFEMTRLFPTLKINFSHFLKI